MLFEWPMGAVSPHVGGQGGPRSRLSWLLFLKSDEISMCHAGMHGFHARPRMNCCEEGWFEDGLKLRQRLVWRGAGFQYAPATIRRVHQFRPVHGRCQCHGAVKPAAVCTEIAQRRHRFILESLGSIEVDLPTEHTLFQAVARWSSVNLMGPTSSSRFDRA